MKKSSYSLIGFVLILMMIGPIVTVRGTTYSCTGVVGAEAIWKVKTVHEGALTDIFGSGWSDVIQDSFGDGSNETGAKMKAKVTFVNSSFKYNLGLGDFDICLINSSVWTWTTEPFSDTPNETNSPTWIFMHPENLTTWCQYLGLFWFGGNVSQRNAFPFLSALPVPVETYLSELVWDNDYTIQGTTVIHNVIAPYLGGAFFVFLVINYLVNCTETWRYSSSYGTFLGYKLVHNNETVAYETALVTPSAEEIPGFELLVLAGTSIGTIVCIIYVIMKKRK